MGYLKRALFALPIVAALIATPAAAVQMLAHVSGDYNDAPYWQYWQFEFRFNANELSYRPISGGHEFYWDSSNPKHSIQYVRGTFVGETCTEWTWYEGCVPETEVRDFELSLNDITYFSIKNFGYLYSMSFGGPTSAFSFGHYPTIPVSLSPVTPVHISGYGSYGGASLDGESFGNIHTHNIDIVVSAAPEPSTWALLIAGFGLAGAALRAARSGSSPSARPGPRMG